MKLTTLLTSALLYQLHSVAAFTSHSIPFSTTRPSSTLNAASKILSDIDIMCIMNTTDLCSYYDECDVEERAALINRLEEQTEFLAERLAMMSCLNKHLETGDHQLLQDGETSKLKTKILNMVNGEKGDFKNVSP